MRTTIMLFIAGVATLLPTLIHAADQHKTELLNINVETIRKGLKSPWGMEMLPDGQLLVTLKSGKMKLISPENPKTDIEVKNLPKVLSVGQGGLLDIALDKDFTTNNRIFLTASIAGPEKLGGTAVFSAILKTGNQPALENTKQIFAVEDKTSGGRHFGSRIVIANDGTLFITIGDHGEMERAQDPFDTAGSVIRINVDGSVPEDNPFKDGVKALPQIWSIGHRNAQGAALNPETGKLWTLSHGAKGGDEINQPEAGKNYGWPTISYGRHYWGEKIGIGTSAPGMEQPVYYWDPSIAPSGLDFYHGNLMPQWGNNLFAGALKYKMLVRLEVKDGKIVHEEQMLKNAYGRIREVRSFPDGALWLLANDKILRITPAE